MPVAPVPAYRRATTGALFADFAGTSFLSGPVALALMVRSPWPAASYNLRPAFLLAKSEFVPLRNATNCSRQFRGRFETNLGNRMG